MKGFVPTPPDLVDTMIEKLFRHGNPSADQRLLDPGCGTGAFIEGVLRWCRRYGAPTPRITGVESDPKLLPAARDALHGVDEVTILDADFLELASEPFDYIVGNPPYVPITGLTVEERTRYRRSYQTARGRFDLYLLFFEQALRILKPSGRLVFVTPEKFLYVQTAEPLRRQLARTDVEEIELIAESVFGNLVTYPTITTISGTPSSGETRAVLRDGTRRTVRLSRGGQSWLPLLNGTPAQIGGATLADAFARISCGVATGADDVYVIADSELPGSLRQFAFPTIAGRTMVRGSAVKTTHSMLVPYAKSGALLSEKELGPLGDYLRRPERQSRLMQRTCVARKPWYAFHENPPLRDLLKPKILCKDIGQRPWFVADESGRIVPRHSVYYLVPKHPEDLHDLCEYLNSESSVGWLEAHCQRAANGFFRLQSHVLKRLPLPEELVRAEQLVAV